MGSHIRPAWQFQGQPVLLWFNASYPIVPMSRIGNKKESRIWQRKPTNWNCVLGVLWPLPIYPEFSGVPNPEFLLYSCPLHVTECCLGPQTSPSTIMGILSAFLRSLMATSISLLFSPLLSLPHPFHMDWGMELWAWLSWLDVWESPSHPVLQESSPLLTSSVRHTYKSVCYVNYTHSLSLPPPPSSG